MENFSTILQMVWRPAQKNSWGVASTPPPDRARVNTESYGLVVKVTPMLPYNFGPPPPPVWLSKRCHVSAYNSETVGWAWHFDPENRNKNVPAFNRLLSPMNLGRRTFRKSSSEKWHFNTESYGLVVKVTPMLPYHFGPLGINLTLAGTGHFASFHGTRGGGLVRPPLAVSPLIELELREKKRACCSPRDEEIDI